MSHTRLIGALFFLMLANWPNYSLALVEARASWRFTGSVLRADVPSNDFASIDDSDTRVSVTKESFAAVEETIILGVPGNGAFGGDASIDGDLSATAGVGILKARVNFRLEARNSFPLSLEHPDVARAHLQLARATASWRDTRTWNVPGFPHGFPMYELALINVSGHVGAGVGGNPGCPELANTGDQCAFARAGISILDATGLLIASGDSWQSDPPAPNDHQLDLPNGTKVVIQEFLNGVPRDIGFTLDAAGNALTDIYHSSFASAGTIRADTSAIYSETLTWGGILGVFNSETQEPIENWTVTSESGFNYSKPYGVPEPSSALLLVTVLYAAPSRRRRAVV